MQENWILLTDYAAKYRVSVSTLRRKIRTGEVAYRFQEGKYWLPDLPDLTRHDNAQMAAQQELKKYPQSQQDLRATFVQILQEKEVTILKLKEEIMNLRTLVGLLEQQVKEKTNKDFLDGLEI